MSRGVVLALVLVAALAVGGVVYVALPRVGKEVAVVSDKVTWGKELLDAVRAELPQLTIAAQLLIVAHGAYESGWGAAKAATHGHNVFNLTAGTAWTGAKWTDVGGDTEYDAQGNVKRITQVWRSYPSLRAAVADYWNFLGPGANRGRYVTARQALERGDVSAFAEELFKAGYFTLPPAKYSTQLAGVLGIAQGFLS